MYLFSFLQSCFSSLQQQKDLPSGRTCGIAGTETKLILRRTTTILKYFSCLVTQFQLYIIEVKTQTFHRIELVLYIGKINIMTRLKNIDSNVVSKVFRPTEKHKKNIVFLNVCCAMMLYVFLAHLSTKCSG